MSDEKNKSSGANAVGHNNVITAIATGIYDLVSKKGVIKGLNDNDRVDGKTCLITGANAGLGKATAIEMARRGAKVIMACRSGFPEAGDDVKAQSGSALVEMLKVDLSDMNSVVAFCDEVRDKKIKIDILILNAGLVPLNARKSAQGYELMFAVHFLANRLLLARFVADGVLVSNNAKGSLNNVSEAVDTRQKHSRKRSLHEVNEHFENVFNEVETTQLVIHKPRVIFVSSEAHQSSAPIDFENFGAFQNFGLKDGMKHYGLSKLHMTTLAKEFSRRVNRGNENTVFVSALCPGPIASSIAREAPGYLKPLLNPIMKTFFNSPEVAAEPVIFLACTPQPEKYQNAYLHMMREKSASPLAEDKQNGKLLWEKSAVLLKDFLPATV